MSNPTGIRETLDQLAALKDAVRDFAAREERLNAAFRDQTARENTSFETQKQNAEASMADRRETVGHTFETARNHEHLRFEQRQSKINFAHGKLQKQMLADVDALENESKNQAHQGVIDAEHHRDADLTNAAKAFEQFQQRHGDAVAAYQQLEKKVRSTFGGYGKFRRLLNKNNTDAGPGGDGNPSLDEFQRLHDKILNDAARLGKLPAPKFFRFLPLWLLTFLLASVAIADPVLHHFGINIISYVHAGIAGGVWLVLMIFYFVGGNAASPIATTIAADVIRARRFLEQAVEAASAHHQQEQERIEAEFQETKNAVNQAWRESVREITRLRSSRPAVIDDKAFRIRQKLEKRHQERSQRLQQTHDDGLAALRREADVTLRQLAEAHKAKLAQLETGFQSEWQKLEADWRQQIFPMLESLQSAAANAEKKFPDWQSVDCDNWTPPGNFQNAVKFGRLEVDLGPFIGQLPKDHRLSLPGARTLSVPLLLSHPHQGSILFETGKDGGKESVGAINNIILRLLATTPPGKLAFTIFDPVGLGQNFAALMHLADYEESCINSRIWTQSAQFEEKLGELNEHMEKIIQMYLRNEYATISEYNAEAGSIAEKYHFLVVASFPVNFTDTAAKRLRNIAASGARCGVFTLVQWDQRNGVPQDFVPDELRHNSIRLVSTDRGLELSGWKEPGVRLLLDTPPSPDVATRFLHQVGEKSRNSNRVEVSFDQVAPDESDLWKDETTEELRVPIGRSGATKLQYLAVGRDTRQHALIAGKTGSGKSTLFHVIINNLALRCSPEQVEFYLVDFKKGVEFKCYATHHLPHARVVAIESDRAFGLSVLQRVDDELRRRGDLFRKVGAQDLAGYKRAGGTEPVPRTLLMIDEFQEFFVEEDRISQGAAVLLDRIVRQGRAFGIHVLLGSQTLGGAYTLARATIGQMVIRIALQCNESDAYLIMDQDNPAPRLLSRPGEGIYNDTAGSIEGNSPFQAVWLSDKMRDSYLAKVRVHANKTGRPYPGPIVFEGNAPADARDNLALQSALKQPGKGTMQPVIWLGAPNSIKGPTEAAFRRQSGSNLLVVGQSDERSLTMVSVALISLAAQFPQTRRQDAGAPSPRAKFFVFDTTPAESSQQEYLQRVLKAIPQEIIFSGNATLAETTATLGDELKRRLEGNPGSQEIFVFIRDIQNFKKLRQEDEFSFSSSSESTPASVLKDLLTEGPAHGIHVVITCDTYNNVNRFLGRKLLSEMEMRVVFQMSATDSANLIDSPDASTLGLHRAVFFNEREGHLETFRPYAQPDLGWIETVAQALRTSSS